MNDTELIYLYTVACVKAEGLGAVVRCTREEFVIRDARTNALLGTGPTFSVLATHKELANMALLRNLTEHKKRMEFRKRCRDAR